MQFYFSSKQVPSFFIFYPFYSLQISYSIQFFVIIKPQAMRSINIIKFSISLSYLKHDFNRKRNMIIHHGLMGSSKNFNNISKNINFSKHVNSYLIDCRNHGNSPHLPTNSIEDLADDICDFIKQHKLNENKSLTLMGHSMGGMALMKFTQKYPEMQDNINRIILIDIFCTPLEQNKNSSTEAMLKKMLQINLNQQTKIVFDEIQKRSSGKDVAGLLKMNIQILGEKNHKWIPNLETIVKDYYHLNHFQLKENQWRKPVELIYGAKSNYINVDQIEKYIELYPQMKQQNFHQIQNAGHWVHFQNPSSFLKTLNIILQKE